MFGTCNCYSCIAVHVFGTIYALRCDTAASRQLTSIKAYATVPKGIMDSGLYDVLNAKS